MSNFTLLLGRPIVKSREAFVDRRYFAADESVKIPGYILYRPVYPAVMQFVQDYLVNNAHTIDDDHPILKSIVDLKDPRRRPAEIGFLVERVFYTICVLRFLLKRSPAAYPPEILSYKEISNLLFQTTPSVQEFHGTFPEIQGPGIYWSRLPSYPLVEGFAYTGQVLFGIQCTITHPTKRRAIKVEKEDMNNLHQEIGRFCLREKVGFCLLYVVPDKLYPPNMQYRSKFNLMNFDTFIQLNTTAKKV